MLGGLETFPVADKWGERYPAIIRLWENAWAEFVPFLAYSPEIRKVLYSTNAIESVHARLRRSVRARGHFPTEQAAMKCLYLAVRSLDPTGQRPSPGKGFLRARRTLAEAMLSAYLFGKSKGGRVEAWADSLHDLGKSQVLWLDLLEPSDDEERELKEALGVDDLDSTRLDEERIPPALVQHEGYIRVTAVAVAEAKGASAAQRVALDCFVGENWVVTAHTTELEVIEDFRKRAEGGGEIGILDAPSFLAALLEWHVASYLRAFAEIEETLEKFDLRVLRGRRPDTEEEMGQLVEARIAVGALRRSLAPHREMFAALSHAEFDPVSTKESAERFDKLTEQVDVALAAARDAKDAIVGSFDVLIARTEHRTNEIMKVLTLASILLLPGALIAGVMGMNVNLKGAVFAHSPLFWAVDGAILAIAAATLATARMRRWI